jgi:hypothetical protein
MEMSAVFSIVKAVLMDRNVIIAAIGVVLYLNFVAYVQSYHKKPPKLRTIRRPPVQAVSEESEKNDTDTQPDSVPAKSQESSGAKKENNKRKT